MAVETGFPLCNRRQRAPAAAGIFAGFIATGWRTESIEELIEQLLQFEHDCYFRDDRSA